jgi:hypothetical protein
LENEEDRLIHEKAVHGAEVHKFLQSRTQLNYYVANLFMDYLRKKKIKQDSFHCKTCDIDVSSADIKKHLSVSHSSLKLTRSLACPFEACDVMFTHEKCSEIIKHMRALHLKQVVKPKTDKRREENAQESSDEEDEDSHTSHDFERTVKQEQDNYFSDKKQYNSHTNDFENMVKEEPYFSDKEQHNSHTHDFEDIVKEEPLSPNGCPEEDEQNIHTSHDFDIIVKEEPMI